MPVPPPAVTVVIPIRNAARYLPTLLPRLFSQQEVDLREVILLDSMSTDASVEIASAYEKVRILPEENFSHGGTRNRGIREAGTPLVALMTQDALPEDDHWLANLLAPLADEETAYSFSRQLPYPDTDPVEVYFLEDRFPDQPKTYAHQGEDLQRPEAVFCSNVSAALKKEIALRHPFEEDLIMGEDQQFSRDLQAAGYQVVYVPGSRVIHSHNYSLWQTFQRYFDSVIAFTQIFSGHGVSDSARMGIRLLWEEGQYHWRHHPRVLFHFAGMQVAKALATLTAHAARFLPCGFCRRCSMNPAYWKKSA